MARCQGCGLGGTHRCPACSWLMEQLKSVPYRPVSPGTYRAYVLDVGKVSPILALWPGEEKGVGIAADFSGWTWEEMFSSLESVPKRYHPLWRHALWLEADRRLPPQTWGEYWERHPLGSREAVMKALGLRKGDAPVSSLIRLAIPTPTQRPSKGKKRMLSHIVYVPELDG